MSEDHDAKRNKESRDRYVRIALDQQCLSRRVGESKTIQGGEPKRILRYLQKGPVSSRLRMKMGRRGSMPVARSSRSMAQITYYRSSVLYDDIADTARTRASTTVIHEIFEGEGS